MGKMLKYWSLYRHTTPSGKVYIGITHQVPEHRWNNGKGYMNVDRGPFKNSIIKYGWDNITHEVLFNNLTKKMACKLEKDLIKYYKQLNMSLNVTAGGDGCHDRIPWNKGKKIPNMNNRKGIPLTEEHKAKLRKPHVIKHPNKHVWTDEDRLKASLRKRGFKVSEETKRKISMHSASARQVQLEKDGKVMYFPSAKQLADYLGMDSSWVSKCCRTGKLCKGYKVCYINN